jgi:hypothetical protein
MADAHDTSIRSELTSSQRNARLQLTIDPGFVHARKIETILGAEGMRYIDAAIERLQDDLPPGLRSGRVDHIYKEYLLTFCSAIKVPTLGFLLGQGKGQLFCSTVEVEAAPEVYDSARAVSRVVLPGQHDMTATLEYSTANIHADTTRLQLYQGGTMAVVAEFHRRVGNELIFHPLLMGAPWLSDGEEAAPFAASEWHSYDFFESFPEDIDQFARLKGVVLPESAERMRDISETAFKRCLAEILGDEAKADWGGERSDHFTAHVTMSGKPTTSAFLLKGPARFAPMTLNHLGKNNDQIFRLAQDPAQLLIVQHCHDIGPEVRATLRAFAVQPGSARRYCLMDGRESLRLLIAYDKLERALELSASGRSNAPTV